MLKVNSSKVIYISYFLLILLSYTITLNIIPIYIQNVVSKFLYLSVMLPIFFMLSNSKYTMRKDIFAIITTMSLFSIFNAISFFLNFDFLNAIKYILGNSVFYFLTFLCVYRVSYLYPIRNLLAPFILCSVIIVIISLGILSGYKPSFYLSSEEGLQSYLLDSENKKGIIGFSGPYINQNQFSIIMFISSALFLGILNNTKSTKLYKKYFIIIFLFISIFLTIITVSRASILAIAIVIVIMSLKNYKDKKSFLLLGFFMFFIFSMFVYFDNVVSRLIERVSSDGSSSRTDIWLNALNIFKENYLFGVGSYSYNVGGASLSAHNVYIQQLVSGGILAFIFWFGLILYFIKISVFNILTKKFNKQNNKNLFLSILFIAILIHQLFEATIISAFHPMTLLMFIIMFTLTRKL